MSFRNSIEGKLRFWLLLLVIVFFASCAVGLFITRQLEKRVFPVFSGLALQERNADASYIAIQDYFVSHQQDHYELAMRTVEKMQSDARVAYDWFAGIAGMESESEVAARDGNARVQNVGEKMKAALELEKELFSRFSLLVTNLSDLMELAFLNGTGSSWRDELERGYNSILQFSVDLDLGYLAEGADYLDNTLQLLPQEMRAVGDRVREYAKEMRELERQYAVRFGIDREINDFGEALKERMQEVSAEVSERATYWLRYVSIAQLVGFLWLIVAALVITLRIGRGVGRTMRQVVEQLHYIKEGDLVTEVEFSRDLENSRDETGLMVRLMREVREKLRELIASVGENAGRVLASSQSVNVASRQIAEGANSQASSSEEVSSAMEEMAANIDQNAENAQQSESESQSVSGELMRMLERGGEAGVAVTEIANKIAIVSEIAEQTNILALNAAVEAARAGEHGRGFAVVASEVRKLAERSGSAADEVVQLVNRAVALTEQVSHVMQEIQPRVARSVQLSREVATSSLEQRNGAEQVNNAIQLLNNVSQTNASASEKLAQEADGLSSLSRELRDAVSYFKVDDIDRRRGAGALGDTPRGGGVRGSGASVGHSAPQAQPQAVSAPKASAGVAKSSAAAAKPKGTRVDAPSAAASGGSSSASKVAGAAGAPRASSAKAAGVSGAGAAPAEAKKDSQGSGSGAASSTSLPSSAPQAGGESKVEEARPSKRGGVVIDMSMGTASDSDYESF